MNYKIIDLAQGSEQWLEFRKGKIGGSDVPSMMGCIDAYQKRSELLANKILNTSDPVSEFMAAMFAEGHEIEALARAAFIQKTGVFYAPAVIALESNERLMASLDGISEDGNVIIEIKSTVKKSILDDVKEKIIPRLYNLQIQWQLFISDLKFAYLIVVDRNTRETYTLLVDRDQKLIDNLHAEAKIFLEQMDTTVIEAPKIVIVENATMNEIANAQLNIKLMQLQIDEFNEKVKAAAKQLLQEYGATRIEGFGVVIQEVERAGSIDYSKITELKNVDLEKFRKKSSKYIKISNTKEN